MKAAIPHPEARISDRALVTFHAYVRARAGQEMNEEQAEAFGRDVHDILIQLVFDNGFSVESKRSFPRVAGDYSLRNLRVWVAEVQTWHDNLSRKERTLFRCLQFIP